MIPILSEYKDKEWGRPKQSIDPLKKQAEYHRQNSQFIYSLFTRNRCAWGNASYSRFDELRSYSMGEQSTDRYKKWLSNDLSTGESSTVAVDSFDSTPLSRVAKKEGWYNMMFDNISPAPTILNALHGQFDKMDFDLYVNVIDQESKDLEESEAYLKYFEGQNLEWQNEYKLKAGIPIDENTYYPKSPQEFEMYKAQGGFKLGVARSMQKLCRYSFDISKWDTVTRKRVVDDLICIRYGAVRDYFDSEDNKFKTKWIDPARLVIQFSNEHDYCDSEYAGYFSYWTISNLKLKLPDVDEEKWLQLAKGASGTYGNPDGDWSKYSVLDPTTGVYGYDGFKVPVFETEWIDTDIKKRKYYKDRYGRKQVKDLAFDEAGKDTPKKEIKNVSIRLVRQCNWVIGTDYCFDYGVVKMASRVNYSKPQLTFHVEQLLQPAIMERLVPILDQIEINFLRYQNSLAKMVENGYAINTSMLGNVTLGGQKLKPAEVIKLFKQTGFFLYQYSAGTGLYTGGAALPITAIDGGMKNRVEETLRTLDMWMGTIKTMTGLDVVALSSMPVAADSKEGQGEQVQITLDVLKPILDATAEIKESAGSSIMRRIQIGVRKSDIIKKAYAGVISKSDMETLVRMEGSGVQYGLSLKSRPDRIAKATFQKWIDIALQNTREQRPGIELHDAIRFKSLLDNGADIGELEQQLGYTIVKNKEEAQANSEKMIGLQGEENRKSEQEKIQGELVKIKAEAEAKIAEEQQRGVIKDRQANKEIIRDLYAELREAANAEDGINTSISR